jgi:hypothetical protein
MGNIIKNLYHFQGLMKRVNEKFFRFPKLPRKIEVNVKVGPSTTWG